MRRIGYFAGPGPGVGTFTDKTADYLAYLEAHGGQLAFADLYQITMTTLGTVDTDTGLLTAPLQFRIAAVDYDVPFEGVVYAGGGLGRGWRIARETIRHEIGTAVSELHCHVDLDGSDLLPPADGDPATPQFSLGDALQAGLFDGADVLYRCLVMPAHPTFPIVGGVGGSIAPRGDLGPGDTSLGAVTLFAGTIAEARVRRSQASLIVKAHTERLQAPWPPRTFRAACTFTLYGPMCGVSRTGIFASLSFQRLDAVATAPSVRTLTCTSIIAHPTGYFDRGTLQFTSGALCGSIWPVQTHTNLGGAGYSIALAESLPRLPEAGDEYVLQAGCDKVGLVRDADGLVSPGTCATKFDNLARFGGFPHVPPPSTAY